MGIVSLRRRCRILSQNGTRGAKRRAMPRQIMSRNDTTLVSKALDAGSCRQFFLTKGRIESVHFNTSLHVDLVRSHPVSSRLSR